MYIKPYVRVCLTLSLSKGTYNLSVCGGTIPTFPSSLHTWGRGQTFCVEGAGGFFTWIYVECDGRNDNVDGAGDIVSVTNILFRTL